MPIHQVVVMIRYLIVFMIGLASISASKATSYDALYVIGDSYSDIGARYVDGNGPTAVAYLAQRMNIQMTYPQASNAENRGLDFAASGATSGSEGESEFHGLRWCCQGMLDQVSDFASRVRSGYLPFDPKSTLFFIAGGLNDAGLATEVTVSNLTHEISLLRENGALHVRLALLPTKIPAFAVVGKRLNPVYRRLVPALNSQLGIDLQLSYWGSYFDEVLQHPGRYGITNTTSKCAGRALFGEDETPCATPGTFFYYHEGHPSTVVHQIVGRKLYQEITTQSLRRAR